MKRERIINLCGLTILVVLFAFAAIQIVGRSTASRQRDHVTLRIAHWHLQSGLKEAFARAIREYERLHPDVRIEQVIIPERSWIAWQRTQLVGGNPPDLFEIGLVRGMTEEMLSRYFVPLTDKVQSPNPYNQNTHLAGIPWRLTFIDGMMNDDCYSPNLAEFYGVPSALFTIRVFYNTDLLREITGQDEPPRSFNDFISLCRLAQQWSEQHAKPLVPIAGSKFNAPHLLNALMQGSLQSFRERLDLFQNLEFRTGALSRLSGYGVLRNTWTFTDPPVRQSLELAQVLMQQMQPGFHQLGREDATFAFTQGRALMIVSGNFDVTSLQHEAPFKLGVFELPVPRGQPFGEGTLGSAAEASKQPSGVFGITQASRYQEQALDFLRFFTSVTTNRQFAQDTLWLPGLVDLPPPPGAEAFAPRISGEIDGPLLFPSNDSTRFVSLLFQRNLHLLSSPTGGIDRFIAAMESAYKPALRVDLARNMKDIRRGVSRSDTTIAAWRARSDEPNATQKVTQLTDVQQQQELSYYQSAYELARP